MKEKTNWYWKQQSLQQTIMVPTCTIIHPRLYVVIIIYVQDIPRNFCNIIQAKKVIQRHTIFMTDAEYDYILDEIYFLRKIEFERNVSVNSDEE